MVLQKVPVAMCQIFSTTKDLSVRLSEELNTEQVNTILEVKADRAYQLVQQRVTVASWLDSWLSQKLVGTVALQLRVTVLVSWLVGLAERHVAKCPLVKCCGSSRLGGWVLQILKC